MIMGQALDTPHLEAPPGGAPRPLRPSARSLERWKVRTTEHASVDAFLATRGLANGIHTILGEESPLDILVRARRGAPLIFSFHGNTPRSETLKLPVFTGLNVTRDLDASLVALSDPTLHLDADLRLAWFAGSASLRLQSILPRVLSHLATILDAPRVIFFGGSGGGFASLYYGAEFADSLALVWNPQTDVCRYNPSHIEDYGRVAFGWASVDETKERLSGEIKPALAPVYATGRRNLVIYLQNSSDGHVRQHMIPFLSSLGADTSQLDRARFDDRLTDSVWAHLGQWGDGHASPTPEFLSFLLGQLVIHADWREQFASGGIARFIAAAENR